MMCSRGHCIAHAMEVDQNSDRRCIADHFNSVFDIVTKLLKFLVAYCWCCESRAGCGDPSECHVLQQYSRGRSSKTTHSPSSLKLTQ